MVLIVAPTASFAAARGSTSLPTAARPIASCPPPATATSTSVFGSLALYSYHFPLYPFTTAFHRRKFEKTVFCITSDGFDEEGRARWRSPMRAPPKFAAVGSVLFHIVRKRKGARGGAARCAPPPRKRRIAPPCVRGRRKNLEVGYRPPVRVGFSYDFIKK